MTEETKENRILIVDDQESNIAVLEKLLKKQGYGKYKSLTDPRLVIPIFQEWQPDLLLLDLMMPHMDGFAVMEALKPLISEGDYFPILVLTADISAEAKKRALSSGAMDFLTKPFDAAEVILRIRNLLQTRALHKQLKNQNIILEEKVRERTVQLAASERRYRTLVDNAMTGVYQTSLKGEFLFANPALAQMLGYQDAADVIGVRVLEHYKNPQDRERMLAQLKKEGRVTNFELDILTRDGQTKTALLSAALEDDHLSGMIRDITDRKQAEEQIQRQVETLGALYDLSRLLSETEDFQAVLDLLVRHAVETTHVTFARVLLLEEGDLVARAVFPVRVLDHDLQMGQRVSLTGHPCCQRILAEKNPRLVQAGSPEAGDWAPFFLGIEQTLCVIPLHSHERPLGLLMLGEVRDKEREPFTENKMRLTRSFGEQAASALHRALLHKETQSRLRNIEALHSIDASIAGSFDIHVTLDVFLQHTVSQLGVDAAAVLLLSPGSQTLTFAAGRGFRTETLKKTHLRLGEGNAGRAALERQIVNIPDLQTAGDAFTRASLLKGENFVAYYAAPLIAKGQAKGVLEIFHRSRLEPGSDWLNFLNILAGQAAIAIDSAQSFDSLQSANMNLEVAYDATINGWSKALDLRDKETEGHTQRVTELTLRLAGLMGISEEEQIHLRRGALLHDIGKMGIPDAILLKPDKLTDEEWVIMRQHPVFAYELLSPITYLHRALDIPYYHHEKWDGTGYPRGRQGEQIPLAARIFAVVDVYDALTSDRPYRKAWSKEKVIAHIKAGAGAHFDPKVVEVFLRATNVA